MKKFILSLIISLCSSLSLSQIQNPPISPKWVFEPWVWEDAVNNKDATRNLINGYLDRNIPVGAVIIDSPWEEPIEHGYNTFIFDSLKYNNPKSFIDSLNSMGIHVILWITGVITTDCSLYDEAFNSGYFINNGATTSFWKGSGKASHIDFFNPAAVTFWKSRMNKIFDSLSVDGWKVDQSDVYLKEMSSISTSDGDKTPAEYSEAYYSTIYNYTAEKRGSNGMITARPYCRDNGRPGYWFAPISVNSAGWVGDEKASWDDNGLLLALNNMFISAGAGYAAVGSDIGGYENVGITPDKNLFIRWAQLGALFPVMENGGEVDSSHKPWLFDENTTDIYRYFAELHHELVPYMYSYDIEAHLTGTPIVQPFGERSYPDTSNWNGDWRYLLGDNLFVSAIYQDNTSRTITFPEGKWIDYWNEDNIYQGGTYRNFKLSFRTIPYFYTFRSYYSGKCR